MLELIEKVFPTLIIVLALLATMVYLYSGKYGTGLYWFAAALLNITVVYLIPKGI